MRVIRVNRKRGAALVEYGLLVAGVALVTAVAISVFGHKVNDMVGTAASVLPSSDDADTGVIAGGRIVRTQALGGEITLGQNSDESTMSEAFGTSVQDLINDTNTTAGEAE